MGRRCAVPRRSAVSTLPYPRVPWATTCTTSPPTGSTYTRTTRPRYRTAKEILEESGRRGCASVAAMARSVHDAAHHHPLPVRRCRRAQRPPGHHRGRDPRHDRHPLPHLLHRRSGWHRPRPPRPRPVRPLATHHHKEPTMNERIIATDRDETDACEAGTPGCCIDHTAERDA